MTSRRKHRTQIWFIPIAAALTFAASGATDPLALSDLKRGDAAPPITGTTIDGRAIDPESLRNRVLLITFGETGQANSQEAWREVASMLDEESRQGDRIHWIVVLSKSSDPEAFDRSALGNMKPLILHDENRERFAAYGVIVLPTFVVVDAKGRVACTMSGLTSRLRDTLDDAVDFAVGRISEAEFERRLHPSAEEPRDEARIRAERLLHLAERLIERGMPELAARECRKAIEHAPRFAPARLCLARLLMQSEAIDEAESQFREVLAFDVRSSEAALGVARIGAIRGGPALDEAQSLVTAVLAREPSNPTAHYVSGLVAEGRGDVEAAMRAFRMAAELLLDARQTLPAEETAESDGRSGTEL